MSVVNQPDIQTPKTSARERRHGPQVCCLIYNWAAWNEWMGVCLRCSYIESAGRWQSISQQGRWKKKWKKNREKFSQKQFAASTNSEIKMVTMLSCHYCEIHSLMTQNIVYLCLISQDIVVWIRSQYLHLSCLTSFISEWLILSVF